MTLKKLKHSEVIEITTTRWYRPQWKTFSKIMIEEEEHCLIKSDKPSSSFGHMFGSSNIQEWAIDIKTWKQIGKIMGWFPHSKKLETSKEINQLVADAISYAENKRKLYKTEKEEIEDILGGD